MAKLQLILTCDYEVFGDGSGDVRKCVIEPSERLMTICESNDTRMTFFVDVCEYWAFKEIEEKELFSPGYCPATWMREQMKEMIARGHDVQLHMHPQWLDYKYISDYEWELNLGGWRLPEYIKKWPQEERVINLTELLRRAKQELEELLTPSNSAYRCNAFRAGAWCIQPEQDILQALEGAGFVYDSSVAPGIIRKDALYDIDFSDVPAGTFRYTVNRSLRIVGTEEGHLTELPIWTTRTGLISRMIWLAEGMLKGVKNNACDCSGQPAYKSLGARNGWLAKLEKVVKNDVVMLDFCGRSTCRKMVAISKSAIRFAELRSESVLPLIAIGHPKNFGNDREFELFLRQKSQDNSMQLEKLTEVSFWWQDQMYCG